MTSSLDQRIREAKNPIPGNDQFSQDAQRRWSEILALAMPDVERTYVNGADISFVREYNYVPDKDDILADEFGYAANLMLLKLGITMKMDDGNIHIAYLMRSMMGEKHDEENLGQTHPNVERMYNLLTDPNRDLVKVGWMLSNYYGIWSLGAKISSRMSDLKNQDQHIKKPVYEKWAKVIDKDWVSVASACGRDYGYEYDDAEHPFNQLRFVMRTAV